VTRGIGSSHGQAPGEVATLCGDLIDVSGFSLRDLDELDKSTFSQELRRLLQHPAENAAAGFKSSI
jgi:hypothetical protein